MPIHVPPVPNTAPDATAFAAVRRIFDSAGFTEAAICERLSLSQLAEVEAAVVRAKDSGPLRNASDALTRLFVEGWPVKRNDLEAVLAAESIQHLQDFTLLEPRGDDSLAATVSLYPIEHLFIVSDRYNNADGSPFEIWDDFVYPCLFITTRKFIETLPRQATGDVLDLCAGTGVGAMLIAGQSKHIVGADLTKRCGIFMEFNAKLNGFDNFETAIGDLYAPVAGRQFDTIIVHPPYQPVLEHIATFNSGGADGEHITRRIITEAPKYLKPGGRLYCLCQLTDRDHPAELRIRNWLSDADNAEVDVAFVVYKHHDIGRYTAIETLQERKPHAAWQSWMEALTTNGVKDMVYGTVVLQKSASPLRSTFTARREGPSATVEDLMALLDAETRATAWDFGASIENRKIRALPGSTMRVVHKPGDGKWETEKLELVRESPFKVLLQIDPVTANLLPQMDGTRTCGELRQSLPFAVPPEQFGSLVRMLMSHRVVVLE
ncbi:hypothetical protein F183_A22920 [Bryobacterales bacterium F-183]|nr:hypothetical protein F183_A22920 [Bryobacterales bacterium F-183]